MLIGVKEEAVADSKGNKSSSRKRKKRLESRKSTQAMEYLQQLSSELVQEEQKAQ